MISIIVPIYNALDNLPKLITSVIKQTFIDWELILVDDGSKDNSYSLCMQYARMDERIKVIQQENQGPSTARNTGIKASSGEWITFVDADDVLLDCFLESMNNASQKASEIDIVFAGYLIAEVHGNDVYTYETAVYEGKKEMRKAITQTNILHRCCPWGKMFRKRIISDRNILFDTQLAHSEDRLFFYDFLLHTRAIATTSTIGYLYDSTQSGTLKNKVLTLDKLILRQEKLTKAAHRVIDGFELKGEELFPIAKHLIPLFATAIQGIYFTIGKRNCRQTIRTQQQFHSDFFDFQLYENIKGCEKWKIFLSNSPMVEMAIHQKFSDINKRLTNINHRIAIYRLLGKLLKRTSKGTSFLHAVKILNKK